MAVLSKPIRLRGLKSNIIIAGPTAAAVEAYTASWIEIFSIARNGFPPRVEAYTASWIEIRPPMSM